MRFFLVIPSDGTAFFGDAEDHHVVRLFHKPFETDTAYTFRRSGENERGGRQDDMTSRRIGAVKGRRRSSMIRNAGLQR